MTAGHDLAMSLRAAYLAMHRQADAYLARSGVTADQFVLLARLAQGGPVTQQELARRASSDPNTVRAMLVLLEDRGLVARQRHPTDGRARSVALTKKGRRAHEKLSAGIQPLRARLLSAFQTDEVQVLCGLLDRVVQAMAAAPVKARRGKVGSTLR
jgi:DNA-binding MarR family transcriptional regulator